MSQYPYSPYQQPSPAYYDPNAQRLYAPARRSAVLMFVVGGFMGMCGMCLGAAATVVPMDQMVAASGVNPEDVAKLGFSVGGFLRFMYGAMAVVSLLAAIVFCVLGFFVRKGTMAPAVTSLIAVVLVGLFTLLQLAGSVIQMLSPREPLMGIAVLFVGGFFLLLVWLLVSLIAAIRASASLRDANAQYAQQYWQMQQQAYQQGAYAGYGYGSMPPPPPPPTMQAPQMVAPPPPPPPSPSIGGSDESQFKP